MSSESNFKKIKIVATLGRHGDRKQILKLAEQGVDVFRNNMSHASAEELSARIAAIREAERKLKRPIAALGDLMGPKIRIGSVKEGSVLAVGDRIKLSVKPVFGDAKIISVNYPQILKNIKKGAEIFLGDGAIKLEVDSVTKDGVVATTIVGGDMRSRMGFSCHGIAVKSAGLSAKDREDIKTLIKVGIDIIAVSFVHSASDIEAVRKMLPKNFRPQIIAKIETLAAAERAEEILHVSDGLMVARGDLGFAVPMQEIPFIQKDLINLCRRMGKPVITATQMLESMVASHLPTRAEVADVTQAVLDGTDAVMLSGETALGKFPEEAVKTMNRIVRHAAPHAPLHVYGEDTTAAEAVAAAAVQVADQVKARLIIVLTAFGATARRVARHRPNQPIIALSDDDATIRHLALSWGVHAQKAPMTTDLDDAIKICRKVALNNPVLKLKPGERFVISAGVPFGQSGSTNLIHVAKA